MCDRASNPTGVLVRMSAMHSSGRCLSVLSLLLSACGPLVTVESSL